jgi:hypothetical protein
MKRNLLHSLGTLKQTAVSYGRPMSRQTKVRAFSLLAVAGGLLVAPLRPAAAGPANAPIFVDFSSLHCIEDSGEGIFGIGSDEPYVVFFSGPYTWDGPVRGEAHLGLQRCG